MAQKKTFWPCFQHSKAGQNTQQHRFHDWVQETWPCQNRCKDIIEQDQMKFKGSLQQSNLVEQTGLLKNDNHGTM